MLAGVVFGRGGRRLVRLYPVAAVRSAPAPRCGRCASPPPFRAVAGGAGGASHGWEFRELGVVKDRSFSAMRSRGAVGELVYGMRLTVLGDDATTIEASVQNLD